ncbi:hypothetical protein BSM4216_3600 [Bacillus smithii]|nr:hypothetical protein BSM4216_3600 [Bacillus smithii]
MFGIKAVILFRFFYLSRKRRFIKDEIKFDTQRTFIKKNFKIIENSR